VSSFRIIYLKSEQNVFLEETKTWKKHFALFTLLSNITSLRKILSNLQTTEMNIQLTKIIDSIFYLVQNMLINQ